MALRRIRTDMLKTVWKVGWPIYDSEGRLLLNKGIILTGRHINRLKQLGIPAVYIDDGLLPDVQVDDVICEQTRLRAIKQIKSIFSESGQKTVSLSRSIIKKAEVANIVDSIIDDLQANRILVVNLTDIRSYDDYTFGHSVNVCVLAVLTGISMGFSRVKLSYLGMAALLHDLGKTLVPESILNKPGALTEKEFEEIKKHTCYGHQALSNNPDISLDLRGGSSSASRTLQW